MSYVNKILYKTNIGFDNDAKEILINPSFYLNYKKEGTDDHYSSYENFMNTPEEVNFIRRCQKFYFFATNEFLRLQNLRIGSDCSFTYWWQLYNDKTTGHGDHTHFDPSTPTIFSFVHFISIDDNDPCFHFLNEDGTEEYINEKSNDFIVFGSWSRHRVKKPSSKSVRAIIAGNININKHISGSQYYK